MLARARATARARAQREARDGCSHRWQLAAIAFNLQQLRTCRRNLDGNTDNTNHRERAPSPTARSAGKNEALHLSSSRAPRPSLATPTKHIKATKPAALPYQLAAAATAFAPLAALAGGQAEGTGLALGIEDEREGRALLAVGGFMFTVFFRWSRSSRTRTATAAEYDERRLWSLCK